MNLVDKLVEIAKNPPSKRSQLLARVLSVFVFFFFFLPLLFIIPVMVFDKWLQLPTLASFSFRVFPGGILIGLGLFFQAASAKAQREIGKGTPMPLNATSKLVIEKPYSYCRNPLYFGLVLFFSGISILLGSISSLAMVMLFALIVLSYAKFIEETELEKRFGEAYLEYKKATPFFIPRLSFLGEPDNEY